MHIFFSMPSIGYHGNEKTKEMDKISELYNKNVFLNTHKGQQSIMDRTEKIQNLPSSKPSVPLYPQFTTLLF